MNMQLLLTIKLNFNDDIGFALITKWEGESF